MKIPEVSVSGIPVKAFASMEEALDDIVDSSGNVTHGTAVAINPEKVMRARRDLTVNQVIMNADIRYADGMGVKYVIEKKCGKRLSRIPGCELWEQLMQRAAVLGVPVYILGASEQVNASTVTKLHHLGVNVVGCQDGYTCMDDNVIADIVSSKAKIVSVAMGSPRQELLINKIREAHPQAFYMGVGGSYDVFTGAVKRAPDIWCRLGFEWLYRLLSQPSRILRQKNLITFLWLHLLNKL